MPSFRLNARTILFCVAVGGQCVSCTGHSGDCDSLVTVLSEDVDGASVWLDGRALGGCPVVNACAAAGDHTVIVRAPGQTDLVSSVDGKPGSYVLSVSRATWHTAGFAWEPQRNGVHVERAADGQILYVATYTEDVLDGLWILYYPNGKVKERGAFRAGVREGPWAAWYDNGARRYEGTYVDDQPDGHWMEWCPDGRLKTDTQVQRGTRLAPAGTPDGPVAETYPDGSPRLQGQYRRGRVDGSWTLWGCDGKIEKTVMYRDGVPDGRNGDQRPSSRTDN